MNKIKTVKIKNPDGSISEETYTISIDAENVDMENGKDLQDTIGIIDIDKDGDIASQLENLNTNVNKLNINIEKKSYYFNTVAEMKTATYLKNGDMAFTLGYNTMNDGGAAEYKIRVKNNNDNVDEGFIISISNNLVAVLILEDGIKREKVPNINYFKVESNKLSGRNKALKSIEQQSNKSSCVDVQYNECLIENIRIKNPNNYSDKTGINFLVPGQRQKVDSVYIDTGFKYGMNIPRAYYSQFNDVWVRGEIGVQIGDPSSPSNWIGVLDFNACHINGSEIGIKQVATDTNTICFDKCSFEGDVIAVDNIGKMYFKNTYFGDTPNVNKKINVLTAQPGSETYFDDCTIGVNAVTNDNTDEKTCSLFNLKSDDTNGSNVYVKGGIFNISNNNLADRYSAIYESDSDKNLLYIDDVKFTPSTVNFNHNYLPFKVFNHSPLRSKNPIQNYILNGCMRDPLGNDILTKLDSRVELGNFLPDLVNPFGGKIYEYIRDNDTTIFPRQLIYFYKIPKSFIGKKMVLEVYLYDESDNQIIINSNELGRINYMPWQPIRVKDETRTTMYRMDCTPTKDVGSVTIRFANSVVNKKMRVFAVILKEYCYKNNLSCYKDLDILMDNKKPTYTQNINKGDIVYASPDSTCTGTGWIFNGTSWVVYNDLS